MPATPRICVIIPVYNHGLTVRQVVREARTHFPVIAVDDGSTDDTPSILAAEPAITILTHPRNRGKGAALQTGFEQANTLGFTHAITLDADGQHPVEPLVEFAAASRRQPAALIIGVRDFKAAGAPRLRRWPNALSNVLFRWETGLGLADTQCGYRCYPLSLVRSLRISSDRYAYELEVMVKAAWAGFELVALPVRADYVLPTSRISHFHPIRDFWSVLRVHLRLLWASRTNDP